MVQLAEGDAKKFAKQLFGKIGDIPIAKESERIELRDSYTLMPWTSPRSSRRASGDFTQSSNVDD